jgi:16S rRNA (guanine(966)-N(2))-methyltransferase RsmD
MRVIGGEFRSRRLKSIPGLATRPTPDRLRETLFNILAPRIEGAVFVDAYAGTGAVGIEALSRGAARCVFVENGRRAVEAIRENLHALGTEARATVVLGKVVTALARQQADIVFLDPPYEMTAEYVAALEQADAPLVIAQHSVRFDPGDVHGALRRVRMLRQGDNALSIYERGKALDHSSRGSMP